MLKKYLTAFSLFLVASATWAQSPTLNKLLPELTIANKGELLFEGDEYRYRPWNSQGKLGEVQVLQYIGGNVKGKELFKPFTDKLGAAFPDDTLHVTTVINLDAAMWGTGGVVMNALKSTKKRNPETTLVVDKNGAGKKAWQLGKKGAVLAVIDKSGSVIYLTQKPLSEQEITSTLALLKEQIGS